MPNGKNVGLRFEGTKMLIEVDLTKDFGKSSSGKTNIVASSEGNMDIPGFEGFKLGLNVFKKEKKS